MAGGEGLAVHPDAQGVAASPAEADAGDSWNPGKAVDEVALGVVREFERCGVVTRQVEIHQDLRPLVGFAHVGRQHLDGEFLGHRPDGFPNVVRRVVEIAVEIEFDGDLRFPIDTAGGDVVDGFDLIDPVLKLLGNAAFHH